MIKTIADLDESRATTPLPTTGSTATWGVGILRAKEIREHDAAHGLPADLVVSLMRLHAADPASVTAVARVVDDCE